MAERPVFQVYERVPFYRQINVEFVYNSGFSVSQKQKNIAALHANYCRRFPEHSVLEISSKSTQEDGGRLSAFSLLKYVPSLDRKVTVENIFQSSKTFAADGPFPDLLNVTPKEAKGDPRLKKSGELTAFTFEGTRYPIEPKTIFYNFIYISALLENEDLQKTLQKYDAFTDIEFNPNKSTNCQARAAAVFVSLVRTGQLQKAADFNSFYQLITGETFEQESPLNFRQRLRNEGKIMIQQEEKAPEIIKSIRNVAENKKTVFSDKSAPDPGIQEPKPEIPKISEGSVVLHARFGKGTVLSADKRIVLVSFESVGEKKLGYDWVVKNCTVESES